MKRFLYSGMILQGLFSISGSRAMEAEIKNDFKKCITSESTNRAVFIPQEPVTLKLASNGIKIPVHSINGQEKKYIVCPLKNYTSQIVNNQMSLTDVTNTPWDIQFKTTNDSELFKKSYETLRLQAKVMKINSFINRIFPLSGNTKKYCVYTKAFFQNRSLWGTIPTEATPFFEDAAIALGTRYFTDLTHILVVTGYAGSNKTIYQLAIPLQLSVKNKCIDYDKFHNFYIKNSKATELLLKDSVAKCNVSKCSIAIDVEDTNEEMHRIHMPFHFYGTESDIENLDTAHLKNTLTLDDNLHRMIALYETKKEEPWFSLEEPSSQLKLVLRAAHKNDSKEEIKDDNDTVLKQDAPAQQNNAIKPASQSWSIGKIVSGGLTYAAESLPILMGFALAYEKIADFKKEHLLALLFMVGPDMRRYYEKYYNNSESITLKNEVAHYSTRAISAYLSFKLLDYITKPKHT